MSAPFFGNLDCGTMSGQCRDHFKIILGTLGDDSGITLVSSRDKFGLSWEHLMIMFLLFFCPWGAQRLYQNDGKRLHGNVPKLLRDGWRLGMTGDEGMLIWRGRVGLGMGIFVGALTTPLPMTNSRCRVLARKYEKTKWSKILVSKKNRTSLDNH